MTTPKSTATAPNPEAVLSEIGSSLIRHVATEFPTGAQWRRAGLGQYIEWSQPHGSRLWLFPNQANDVLMLMLVDREELIDRRHDLIVDRDPATGVIWQWVVRVTLEPNQVESDEPTLGSLSLVRDGAVLSLADPPEGFEVSTGRSIQEDLMRVLKAELGFRGLL
jgi:hypothetical protein